jgi:hypothetical protein
MEDFVTKLSYEIGNIVFDSSDTDSNSVQNIYLRIFY